jgi:lipid-A-disaccharide synthase-like uncharacterized protein
MSDYLIFAIGFVGQAMFFARFLVQWFQSEKAGRVLSPTLFWQLSLVGSFLFVVYGMLRDDPVIILGQILTYLVYVRNLQLKQAWELIPRYFRWFISIVPIAAIAWIGWVIAQGSFSTMGDVVIPLHLLIWGSAGQIIFAGRFVYQWYYSEKSKQSLLPIGFWLISILGALMIVGYGIYRLDPVLIAGHAVAILIYSRNLMLALKQGSQGDRSKQSDRVTQD